MRKCQSYREQITITYMGEMEGLFDLGGIRSSSQFVVHMRVSALYDCDMPTYAIMRVETSGVRHL